jgi:hypothetical protein
LPDGFLAVLLKVRQNLAQEDVREVNARSLLTTRAALVARQEAAGGLVAAFGSGWIAEVIPHGGYFASLASAGFSGATASRIICGTETPLIRAVA